MIIGILLDKRLDIGRRFKHRFALILRLPRRVPLAVVLIIGDRISPRRYRQSQERKAMNTEELADHIHDIQSRANRYHDIAKMLDGRGRHVQALAMWEMAQSLKAMAKELCQSLPLVA